MHPFKPGTGDGIPFSGSDVSSFRFIPFFDSDPATDYGRARTTNDVTYIPEVGRDFSVTTVTVLNNDTSHSSTSSRSSSNIFPTIVTPRAFHSSQDFNRNNSAISSTLRHIGESALSTISYRRLPTTGSSSSSSAVNHLECRHDNDDTLPKPIIKSPATKTTLLLKKPNRKCVTFSGSDLVHVTDNPSSSSSTSPFSPTDELFPRYEAPAAAATGVVQEESDLGGVDVFLQDDSGGFWAESSTDADPWDPSGPSARADQVASPPPLSFVNDVFGRTTIFVTSGTFRPSDVGKLNGKTVEDLSGGPRGGRRSLSTGTLNGIQSNRTRVRIDVTQGVLLDINHNPGQTAEVDSKAVMAAATQDPSAVYSNIYSGNILKDAPKGVGAKEFPKKSWLVKQKICDKLSRYKCKLILIFCLTFLIVSLTIGLALGLRH